MREGSDQAREVEHQTDAVLVSAIARGDAAAFRLITERHLLSVHRLATRMLGDSIEAEEVAQDTFLKLWTRGGHWRPSKGDSPILPWLRSLAMNACIDRLRRRRFQSDEEVPERADEAPSTAEQIDQRRLSVLVSNALGELPDRQRAAIVLTYYEDLPNVEAADAMSLHLKGFESLLFRARQTLKAALIGKGICADDLRKVA